MSNRPTQSLLTVILFTSAVGCSSSDDDDSEATFVAEKAQNPKVFENAFAAAAYGFSACDTHDGQLRGRRELRIFSAGEFNADDFTRGLSRYYARHDLTFFTRYPALQVVMPYAVETDEKRLDSALRKQFPKVDFDDEDAAVTEAELKKIQSFAARWVLRPVLTFVDKFGHQDPSITNLILLPAVASTKALEDEGATLAGLSISPQLIKTLSDSDDEDGVMWRAVGLPETFNAMVFVNAKFLRTVKPTTVTDLVIAHEFGHSAGLVHVMDLSNLMTPATGPDNASCVQSLDIEQLSAMGRTLGVGGKPLMQALRVPAAEVAKPKSQLSRQVRWSILRQHLVGPNARPARLLRGLLDPHVNGSVRP